MFSSKSRLLAASAFLSLSLLSSASHAGWTLNQTNSSLYYVTSKAAAVSELNSFGELEGAIDDSGHASVSVNLGSVDTAVDIRNERMREVLFQVANYPLATAMLDVDGARLGGMAAGQSYTGPFDITVSLHGMEQTIAMDLRVTRLRNGGVLVSLVKPLIVNASTFGLAEGVEQLRDIAGLPSINNNVVVDFTLQFDETN